jgi:hypothetical protein
MRERAALDRDSPATAWTVNPEKVEKAKQKRENVPSSDWLAEHLLAWSPLGVLFGEYDALHR